MELNSVADESDSVQFIYEDTLLDFTSVSSNDHILRMMRETKSFYEEDVLDFLRAELPSLPQRSTAIDAGTFIGTHSIFFAQFIGFSKVISFEANPSTFNVLQSNIAANRLGNIIRPINKALGSKLGHGQLDFIDETNGGSTSVKYSDEKNNEFVITTIDNETAGYDIDSVQLLKIDVEGFELEVLKGAQKTITKNAPLICIEVHTFPHLIRVLAMLRSNNYVVLDCLGASPTYILKVENRSFIHRQLNNLAWIFRSGIPTKYWRTRWYLKRIGQKIIGR